MTKKLSRRRSLTGMASILATSASGPVGAFAQTALPDTALRLLVGYAAGGGSELMARVIAPKLEARTGRRVTVANKPSGTGFPAGSVLGKDLASGAVVAFMPSTTLSSTLAGDLFPFDSRTGLVPLTVAGTFQTAFSVAAIPEVGTLADYIKWVKAEPSERSRLGISAPDAYLRIYSMMIGRQFGLDLKYVPFGGAAELVSALRGGRIAAGLSSVAALLEHNRDYRTKVLMTSGRRRVSILRDVPTVVELGYPGLELEEWYGFFASSASPRPVVAEWDRLLSLVLAESDVVTSLAQFGLDVEVATQEQAARRFPAHLQAWRARKESFGLRTDD